MFSIAVIKQGVLSGSVETPTDPLIIAFREDAIDQCFDQNTIAAGNGTTYEYISGGAYYNPGEGMWDNVFGAVIGTQLGLVERAKDWMRNFIDLASSGQLPGAFGDGFLTYSHSQPPIVAWGAWEMYQTNQDSVWLGELYDMLVDYLDWFETNRKDASGLFFWGAGTGNTAALESGQDAVGLLYDVGTGSAPYNIAMCCPDICSMMAREYETMASIATLLGHSSDATAYSGKRTDLIEVIQNLMWDEIDGIFRPVDRADVAKTLGTLNADANMGATSISLDAGGSSIGVHKGERIIIGSVYVQAAATTRGTGVFSIPLVSGLSAGVSSGTSVTSRRLTYYLTLANTSLPLWAGITTSPQATSITDEWLLASPDGTEEAPTTVNFGTQFNSFHVQHEKLDWMPDFNGFAGVVNEVDATITSEGLIMTLIYRNRMTDFGTNSKSRLYYSLFDEIPTDDRPVRISVTWVKSLLSNVKVVFEDRLGNAIATNCFNEDNSPNSDGVLTPGGIVGDTVTTYLEYRGSELLNKATVTRVGASNITVFTVKASSFPSGFLFQSPHGMLSSSRFGCRGYAYSRLDPNGQFDTDYWSGDHWVNLEYLTAKGLTRAGKTTQAREVAEAVFNRVYREWDRTGEWWERYGMRGGGRGSLRYTWTALACLLQDDYSLAVPSDGGATPVAAPGVQFWFEAENVEDVAAGEPVEFPPDVSGFRNEPYQFEFADLATLEAAQINGLPALLFNGVAQAYDWQGTLADGTALTLYAVAKMNGSTYLPIVGGDHSVGIETFIGPVPIASPSPVFFVRGINDTGADVPFNDGENWHLYTMRLSGSVAELWIDGALEYTGSSIGEIAFRCMGRRAVTPPQYGSGGLIQSLVICSNTHNDPIKEAIESYFLDKTNL